MARGLRHGPGSPRPPPCRARAKAQAARVDDTGFHRGGPNQHRIHVIVEGPNTAIVKSARARNRFSDGQARKFVATLNMLSRQLA